MIENAPPWPDGNRCAVAFSFDVDADSVVHASTKGNLDDALFALQYMRYDPAVAIPRLTRMFAEHEVPATFFVPAWVAKTYPQSMQRILQYDNEIAHHGYFHEWPSKQSVEQQRETLVLGREHIEQMTGVLPTGYRAPYYGVTNQTIEFLAELGFDYDSSLFADDVPMVLETKNGRVIELPIPDSVDDYNQYVSARAFDYLMTISPPERALSVFKAEFDALWEFGGLWISVWHPAVSGRPSRALAIRSLIQHMQEKGDVWFATHQQIAEYVQGLMASGRWQPRVDRLPLYTQPVLNGEPT